MLWLLVAKYVRVQLQLWLEDGWAVPAKLRRGMPERAMHRHDMRHERGSACCAGVEELMEVLLGHGYAKKLKGVSMKPCDKCGSLSKTSRKKWLRGAARASDRRVFCSACLRVEYELEQEEHLN